jgi:hypothetical protein
VAVRRTRVVQRLPGAAICPRTESALHVIGPITLGAKRAGERSARNSHAAFDEAGAGNGITVKLVRHSHRKRGATDRLHLRSTAPAPDPTGGRGGREPFPTPIKTPSRTQGGNAGNIPYARGSQAGRASVSREARRRSGTPLGSAAGPSAPRHRGSIGSMPLSRDAGSGSPRRCSRPSVLDRAPVEEPGEAARPVIAMR